MKTLATLLLLAVTVAPTPPPSVTARVAAVVDGDTIVLADNTVVRYIGVDAPERHLPGGIREPFSEEAKTFNARMVEGKPVLLRLEVGTRDAYNRLLAHVFVDGVLVGSELVRWGYAKASPHSPNCMYSSLFRAMELSAKRQNRGLWARENLMER